LHLINGLFDCHRSRLPVLAIAAHIPSSEIGLTYFQETHPQELFRECSHYVELVSTASQMPQVLQRAMRTALLSRGVAVIVLPGDIAVRPVQDDADADWPEIRPARILPADAELDRVTALLNKADAVTMLCGAGCAGAHDELLALADSLGAPSRPRARRQGTRRMGQSERRRHDRSHRVQLGLPRHAVVRSAADAGH
jgi:pyruvate dehydrogenase (quinone)